MNKQAMKLRTSTLIAALLGSLLAAPVMAQAPAAPAPLQAQPAKKSTAATLAPIQGAAHAGKRLVTVGDYGTILLSDDGGKSFRQAASVPVSSTLTAVHFADDRNGWAVGQWGAIIHTADGGENWTVQRLETQEDRPLFSVHFTSARDGIAVGLWSLLLRTQDGGKTWTPVDLPAPPEGGKADRNLFRIFASAKGELYVAAERGMVLRSADHGRSWQYLNTGYKGSFWTGVALKDGTLLVGGLRGTLYRSTDDGRSWQPVVSGSKSSVTDLVEGDGHVFGTSLDGVLLDSTDGGASFTWKQRDDRLSLTAALVGSQGLVRFSRRGVITDGFATP